MLLIDEHIKADGATVRTRLGADGEHVRIESDDGITGKLSIGALEKVMRRYGRALAPEIVVAGDSVDFGGGRVLTHLKFRAKVDAISRDWLVWSDGGGGEPIAALSNGVAAALRYLVLALRDER